jgi:hypothetical protein
MNYRLKEEFKTQGLSEELVQVTVYNRNADIMTSHGQYEFIRSLNVSISFAHCIVLLFCPGLCERQ